MWRVTDAELRIQLLRQVVLIKENDLGTLLMMYGHRAAVRLSFESESEAENYA